MSKALYRTYRSKSLDEIVGQEHITAILKRAIASGKIAHAYLLTGPRGVGKTSIARILAHAINDLPYTDESNHLDIIEIDAASNNSVDDVRELRERVQIAPVSAKRKVYIIDEVHMLSKQAFNALLKTLEEPPEHVVFILATTDADKLPATIISRVQRFNFKAITPEDAAKHLKTIAKKEKIAIDDDALQLIATHGKGSFRDSISLLDQMQHLSDGTITYDMVADMLGLADQAIIDGLLNAYSSGDIATVVGQLQTATENGTPAHVIAEQLITAIRQNIATNAQWLPLLDDLLDVPKSAWPDIKLLTALTKQVAQPAVIPPTAPVTQQPAPKPAAAPTPQAPKAHPKPKTEPAASKPAPAVAEPTPQAVVPKASVPFEWAAFTDGVKPKAAGAHALLKNCGHDYDGVTLTIYAGKKFHKTKLDKALPELSAVLVELGMQAEIVITDSAKPPEDATTAAILDMMGGGEEVSAAAE